VDVYTPLEHIYALVWCHTYYMYCYAM